MLAERLDKAWTARRRSRAIDPVMRLSDEGLVLGAGTVLAKSGGAGRHLSIDPLEPRLQVLLAAAHLRRPTVGALAHLRKAAERWSEGHDTLAVMHLALSQVDRLAQPEADAHRLFLADGLLTAGFEANAIIDAIEAGGAELERLQKYDPNQPRVPAGSGRASGEWTSTGDGSSVDASPDANSRGGSPPPGAATPGTIASTGSSPLQSLVYRPEGDPVTATPVALGSINACEEAGEDCLRAAIRASANDAANDNFRLIDIANCEGALYACDAMSWMVEDIPFLAETGQGGGVLFPHGGVVLIKKGQLDRYIPPLRGGRRPSFKRRAGTAAEADGFSFPPWSATREETIVSNPTGFSACRKVIGILASRMDATVTERVCSLSKEWGKVIRAKIAYAYKGSPTTALVTCCSTPGSGVGIFMKLDNCCGSDSGHPSPL